jgi:hypothetical protein
MTTFYTVLEWLFVAFLCIVGLLIYRSYQEHKREREERTRIKRREDQQYQLQLEHQRAALDFDRAMTQSLHLAAAHQANYKARYGDREISAVYRFPPTRVTMEQPAQPLQIEAPAIRQPTQRFLLDQLEENMLQVSPGVRTNDGSPVVLSIPDAVHFKLIGSSGFGKSCLAGAMLDQAVKLNSPDVLQIALLDLEHKTSRLFEHSPNVAIFQVGKRRISMVATNADEVAEHLGYIKKEIDRRAQFSEYDLQSEPLLLCYLEEMLSLQYEVDEALLAQMLKDLGVLAVRGRKYNVFILACSQTDYSTPELRTAQKQFRSRMAFAIDTTAARAAGFMNTELIKHNFTQPKDEHTFVLETPGLASLMIAPAFDVRAKVLAMDTRSRVVQGSSSPVQDVFTASQLDTVNSPRTRTEQLVNTSEQGLQAKRTEVEQLRANGWGKVAIIEKVWNCKRGGSQKWKQAESEYDAIIADSTRMQLSD